ncbi:4900_t:CDS:1, partial [Racocetra persica]
MIETLASDTSRTIEKNTYSTNDNESAKSTYSDTPILQKEKLET